MTTVRHYITVQGDTVPGLIAALRMAQEGYPHLLRTSDIVELYYDRPKTGQELERDAKHLEYAKADRRKQYLLLKEEFEP